LVAIKQSSSAFGEAFISVDPNDPSSSLKQDSRQCCHVYGDLRTLKGEMRT
jgi:hypothetical protein